MRKNYIKKYKILIIFISYKTQKYIWILGGIYLRTINVGVIGVGAMGYNHARVYSKLENANLVAVADVVKPTLDKVVKKYKTKG